MVPLGREVETEKAKIFNKLTNNKLRTDQAPILASWTGQYRSPQAPTTQRWRESFAEDNWLTASPGGHLPTLHSWELFPALTSKASLSLALFLNPQSLWPPPQAQSSIPSSLAKPEPESPRGLFSAFEKQTF